MKRLLSLCALLLAAPAAPADDAADARKVVEKAIKAMGRTEKDAPKAVSFKAKGTFYGMGMEVPYSGSWATHYPDKTRMEIENFVTIVVNGDKGWLSAGGQTMDMPEEMLQEHKESLYADWVSELVPLVTEKGFTLNTAGEGKVEGKATVAVKVAHKGRRDLTLHFEKDSGLLVKIDQRVKDPMAGGEFNQESIFKEFTTVGKVKVPRKMVMLRDGKPYVDGEMSDYKFSDKLPAETFEKP